MKFPTMKRKSTIGIAAAIVSATAAGALLFGSSVWAQSPTPTTPNPAASGQGAMRGHRGPGGRHGHFFGSATSSPHAVAAKVLGIDEAVLRTELQAGKTIAAVAAAKGVDLATISAAILDAQKADLAQAVTDGKLTQTQADQLLTNAPARIADMLNRSMPERPGGHGGKFGAHHLQATVAKALGVDEAALRTELQAGKTIADVAKAKGVDLAVVQTAVLDAQKAELAQAVTDGRMTQAQADQKLADAPARITEMLNSTRPQPSANGFGGRSDRGGRGGHKGGQGGGVSLPAAATALGIDESALRTELQSGKSIADVAKAKNIDVNTVISALVTAKTSEINQAVTDGKLTQAQADQKLSTLSEQVNSFVNAAQPLRNKGLRKGPSNTAPAPVQGAGA